MNKKGAMEFEAVIKGIIVVVVIFAVVFFLSSEAFPSVRKAIDNFAAPDVVKKAYRDVFKQDEILTEEEKITVDAFEAFFNKHFMISDDLCVKEIDFDELANRGFRLRMSGGNIFVEKEDWARVHRIDFPVTAAFLKEGNDFREFVIDEGFEKINEEGLGESVFKTGNFVYFLDGVSAADLEGEYSTVFAKKKCGEGMPTRIEVEEISGDDILLEYLEGDFNYLGRYEILDLIVHITELENARTFSSERYSQIGFAKGLWELNVHNFFAPKYGGSSNWRLVLTYTNPELGVTKSIPYGGGPFDMSPSQANAQMTLTNDVSVSLTLIYPSE